MIPYLIAFGFLLLVLAWFFLGNRGDAHEPTARKKIGDDIDQTELEEAERDAREASDEEAVRDWGPGTARPRPPEIL